MPQSTTVYPEFTRVSTAGLIVTFVKSIIAFAEEIDGKRHSPSAPPREAPPRASVLAQRLLLHSLETHLDHWESAALATAPPWLKNEFADLRWMVREAVRYHLSFGPSHEQPH